MAVTATPVFVQTPNITLTNYSSAQAAAAYVTIYTGAANCSKVVAVNVVSNATESHTLSLAVTRNSTAYVLGSYIISSTTGTGTDGATPSVNMLAGGPTGLIPSLPVDNDGQRYLYLTSLDTLQISSATSFTGGKKMDVICIGADF